MNENGWQCFLKLCLNADNESMLSDLFSLFLTEEEKASIETRCLVVKELLAQNKTQRQIAEDLHVSIAKITRGSNELKRVSSELKEYLKKQFLIRLMVPSLRAIIQGLENAPS